MARTVRTRFLSIPARLVNTWGTPTLRAPLQWPWAKSSNGPLTFSAPFRPFRCSRLFSGGRTADDRRTALTIDDNH